MVNKEQGSQLLIILAGSESYVFYNAVFPPFVEPYMCSDNGEVTHAFIYRSTESQNVQIFDGWVMKDHCICFALYLRETCLLHMKNQLCRHCANSSTLCYKLGLLIYRLALSKSLYILAIWNPQNHQAIAAVRALKLEIIQTT